MLLPEGAVWGFPICHPDLGSEAPGEHWEDPAASDTGRVDTTRYISGLEW